MTEPRNQFRPAGNDFLGWPMPDSLPHGLVLELSRAPLLDGAERHLDDWMSVLHERYDECLQQLPVERVGLEATFSHTESDNSLWLYHLRIIASSAPDLDTSTNIGRAHQEAAMRTKHAGWEELKPLLFLAPTEVRAAIERAIQRPRQPRPNSESKHVYRTYKLWRMKPETDESAVEALVWHQIAPHYRALSPKVELELEFVHDDRAVLAIQAWESKDAYDAVHSGEPYANWFGQYQPILRQWHALVEYEGEWDTVRTARDAR